MPVDACPADACPAVPLHLWSLRCGRRGAAGSLGLPRGLDGRAEGEVRLQGRDLWAGAEMTGRSQVKS